MLYWINSNSTYMLILYTVKKKKGSDLSDIINGLIKNTYHLMVGSRTCETLLSAPFPTLGSTQKTVWTDCIYFKMYTYIYVFASR